MVVEVILCMIVCSTRVSNELGAGHPRAARLAVYFVFVMAIIEGTLIGAVMILMRNIWGYAYSNEVEVVQYVAIMLPILALSIFLDALQCVLSGFSCLYQFLLFIVLAEACLNSKSSNTKFCNMLESMRSIQINICYGLEQCCL